MTEDIWNIKDPPTLEQEPELKDNGDGTWTVDCGDWHHIFTTDEVKDILKPFPSQTDEELNKVANGMFHGEIFSSLQVRDPSMFTMVFVVMVFADEAFRVKIAIHKIRFVYEYVDKALPRGVNSYPMFMSMCILNNKDTDTVLRIYNDLVKRENLENPRGDTPCSE